NEKKETTIFSPSLATAWDRVVIRSNEDFNAYMFPGTGTSKDPYRIEGLNLNNTSGSTIVLQDTDVYAQIRNNKFNGLDKANFGIELSNVSHVKVSRNIVSNNSLFGMLIRFSTDVTIEDNLVINNSLGGINIFSSDYISISGNAIHYNKGYGIWLRDNVEFCNIVDNGIFSNQNYGLLVGRESDQTNPSSNANFVNENTFEDNNLGFSEQAGNWGEKSYCWTF
ncbi:MAG: right-handed parallel beta-helix repeat-containing protein, partial [Candidatus Kariarchaeaceae archaeon]